MYTYDSPSHLASFVCLSPCPSHARSSLDSLNVCVCVCVCSCVSARARVCVCVCVRGRELCSLTHTYNRSLRSLPRAAVSPATNKKTHHQANKAAATVLSVPTFQLVPFTVRAAVSGVFAECTHGVPAT